MLRAALLPALAGVLATLPVPVALLVLTGLQGHALTHPGLGMAVVAPAIGAVLAVMWARKTQEMHRERQTWTTQRQGLEDRRRVLASEAAELQALELGLLADLEESEAEVDALHAVSTSLATALRDSLDDLEERLDAIARETGHTELTTLAGQVEDLLELVSDVDRFAQPAPAPSRAQAFSLPEVVRETLQQARQDLGGELSWTLSHEAPTWVPGTPERLVTVLGAAVRAGSRDAPGPLHIDMEPIDRGGVVGLCVRWSHHVEGAAIAEESLDDFVAGSLGARLTQALGEPPVGSDADSITWWMRQARSADVVPPPLPVARVLVAASEAPTRARLRRLLCRWGLEVTMARTGEEALARLELQGADVVLIDLEGESLATLERVRASEALSHLPVLLLGPVADNLVWLPTEEGDALTRPVRHEGLMDGVQAALEHHGAQLPQASTTSTRRHRVLLLEPNPAVAARLVRLGADIGCRVHAVASPSGLLDAANAAWDLVLIAAKAAPASLVHEALLTLQPRTPRMLLTPDGRAEALQDTGLDGVVAMPGDSADLLALLMASQDQSAAASTSEAIASRKVS